MNGADGRCDWDVPPQPSERPLHGSFEHNTVGRCKFYRGSSPTEVRGLSITSHSGDRALSRGCASDPTSVPWVATRRRRLARESTRGATGVPSHSQEHCAPVHLSDPSRAPQLLLGHDSFSSSPPAVPRYLRRTRSGADGPDGVCEGQSGVIGCEKRREAVGGVRFDGCRA